MNPPKTVRVGEVIYHIRYTANDAEAELLEGDYGRTFVRRQLILLAADQGPDQARDTVIHELFHTIFAQTALAKVQLPDDDAEEAIIRELAPGWLGVLRRNPKLVAYILEGR